MSANHYPREIQCYICGDWVMTTAPRTMCQECRDERQAENNRIRYSKRARFQVDNRCIKIIFDPLPFDDGGFRVGAEITKTDLDCGMHTRVFTVGTIFLVDGEREVVREIKGRLRLIPA